MTEKRKDICDICGQSLDYATQLEKRKDLTCYFCGQVYSTNIFCPNDHYICDACHTSEPIKILTQFCHTTALKDPFTIADQIMKHPKFKLYGPEHHVLTPAAILTALKNTGIKKPNGKPIKVSDIDEAIRRASKIPGGWCGFYGSCGAGMGSGVAISVFTEATPSTDKERTLANQMTARSLNKIADNLEHCCKRSVKLSICETLEFLRERFNLELKYSPKQCEFSKVNPKCVKTKCPMYLN